MVVIWPPPPMSEKEMLPVAAAYAEKGTFGFYLERFSSMGFPAHKWIGSFFSFFLPWMLDLQKESK